MTSNKYIAVVSGDSKVLRGPVEMERQETHSDLHFDNYVAYLPTIKAEWLTEADNGKLLTLDVDFNTCYDEETDKLELIAVPIDKQEGKPERMFTLQDLRECFRESRHKDSFDGTYEHATFPCFMKSFHPDIKIN